MGLIRGGLLTFACILLFLSLFSMNTFWTFSMSLKYDNVKTELVSIISDTIRNQTNTAEEMDNALAGMQRTCINQTEIVQMFGEETYTFPCEIVNQGSEAVITYAVTSLVEEKYYQEYDCKLWQCSYTPPYHLVSAKAQSYWSNWFYLSILVSLALAVAIFFLVENRNNFPFIVGIILVISSSLLLLVPWLISLLGYWDFLKIFVLFFSKSYLVFLISFVLGIILLGVGLVLKFLGIGKFINNLFGGDKSGEVAVDKEQLKQEIKQEIKEESKKKKKK